MEAAKTNKEILTYANFISSIWKNYKGNMKVRAAALCDHLNIELKKLPRSEYKQNENIKLGDSDENQIRIRSLRDLYDLFVFFHELGHTIYHKRLYELDYQDYLSDATKYEDQADLFATSVLLSVYGQKVKNIALACQI